MDPNEALRMIRSAIADLRGEVPAARGDVEWHHAAEQLTEHVEALDGWLSRGGFLPAAWERTGQMAAVLAASREPADPREPLTPRPGNAGDVAWAKVVRDARTDGGQS